VDILVADGHTGAPTFALMLELVNFFTQKAAPPFAALDSVGWLEQAEATAKLIGIFLTSPELLEKVLNAFAQGTVWDRAVNHITRQLAEALMRFLSLLAVPVAAEINGLVEVIKRAPDFATLLLSGMAALGAQTKPGYTSWPASLDVAQAQKLPATPLGTSYPPPCPPPPPDLDQLPGVPIPLRCLWVTEADLDGTGRLDRLLTWRADTTRGAIAYLDDGSVHPLTNGQLSTSIGTPWSQTVPWAEWASPSGGLSVDTAAPVAVPFLADDRRQSVQLLLDVGGRGDAMAFVGLAADGTLRLADDGAGQVAEPSNDRSTFSCVERDGERLWVNSFSQSAAPPTADDQQSTPSWFTTQAFYDLTDSFTFELVGWLGNTPSTGAVADVGDGCDARAPEAPEFTALASTPEAAVAGLLRAANAGDVAAARPFLAGDPPIGNAEAAGNDPWAFVTSGVLAYYSVTSPTVTCTTYSGADAEQWCTIPVGSPAGGQGFGFGVRPVGMGLGTVGWAVNSATFGS
jgi:hypothetical protein